ncbi:sterol desaturase family protein [Ruegeria hyattellae]|uniref:sterol desaturase family protein n=1 Tax=Ruegeria hyattellae TaxID=3233337 RepID=UPI00355BA259
MLHGILEQETAIRLTVFLGVLISMAVWELAAPRRRVEIPRLLRWSNNLALIMLDTLIVRLAFPVVAVGLAVIAHVHGWGLLNQMSIPGWITFLVAVLVLDLAIYLQHVLFHAVPALWRLHRMHHADLEFDVTTGLRFHPVEVLLSMVIKLGVVMALGPPAFAVLIFEVLLNASSLFNHSNIRLPLRVDAVLRLFIVTPDMHRVHHSIHPSETNSNFGFNVPWWDRIFGTYLAQPKSGHEGMTIGIEQFRSRRNLWLDQMLIQPLLGRASRYPINRADEPSQSDPEL